MVNRACRQPEILTNHTEKERRDDLLVPRITNYGRASRKRARACVHASASTRAKNESREATEETEDLSRRQFGLTDLIRLGRERRDASPSRLSSLSLSLRLATMLTAGRLHCACHSSSAPFRRVGSRQTDWIVPMALTGQRPFVITYVLNYKKLKNGVLLGLALPLQLLTLTRF